MQARKNVKFWVQNLTLAFRSGYNFSIHARSVPREGMIIECLLNGLFHNLVIVILPSRMAGSDVEIPNLKSRHSFMVCDCLPQPLVVVKIRTANVLS